MVNSDKKEVNRSKQRSKQKCLLDVISLIKKGLNPSKIAKELSISKQYLNKYIRLLKEKNIIKKIGYGVWEVNQEEVNESSLGTTKPFTNLHAFQINFPILEGKINDSDWDIKEKLHNWIPKYTDKAIFGGIVIKNNNNKSLTVWLKSRNISNLNEVYDLAFKIRAYMYDYFKKEGVILDVFNCETKNLDLATEDKESEGMLGKGEKFKLDLNKKSEKIFNNDKIDGKAWLDGSPFKFTAETNDLEWKREYLSMPFKMRDTLQLMHYVAKNYASHVKLVEKASNVMDKLDRKLSKDNKIKKQLNNQKILFDY